MRKLPFQDELSYFVGRDDVEEANRVLMEELGRLLVRHKSDFVDLLNESGVSANIYMSDAELVNLYIEHVPYNRKLKVGTALLVNHHNKSMGFDGDTELNNEAVKDAYAVLYSYFDDVYEPDEAEGDAEIANADGEDHSNMIPGMGQMIGGLVGKGADISSKIIDNRRRSKHGVTDDILAQREAKRQRIASVMKQRRIQAENEAKRIEAKKRTTKTVLIVGGVVLGLTVIGVTIYMLKKKSKDRKSVV